MKGYLHFRKAYIFILITVTLYLTTQCTFAQCNAGEIPAAERINLSERKLWRAVTKGMSPASGLTVENMAILSVIRTGKDCIELYCKRADNQLGEHLCVALLSARGALPIRRAILKELEETATVSVITDSGTLELCVQPSGPVASFRPLDKSMLLEVRGQISYTVVPDFSTSQDAIYDPVTLKSEEVELSADNFLIGLLENRRSAFMCVWQGILAGTGQGGRTNAVQGTPAFPTAVMVQRGTGKERHCSAIRVKANGETIHIGVLESDKLWYMMELAGHRAGELIKLNWQRPFSAQWKAVLLGSDDEILSDRARKSKAYVFMNEQKPDYPVWFNGTEAWLKVPETKDNIGPWRTVLVYALDRQKDTPIHIFTSVDIVRQTLGVGPCEYELDVNTARRRIASTNESSGSSAAGPRAPVIEGVPPDTPEQAKLRMELAGQGYIYLPRGNRIYRINADGTDLQMIYESQETREQIFSAQVSWDGYDVAFVVNPPWGKTNYEVRLVSYAGGKAKTIYQTADKSLSVAWTPDDEWLVVMDAKAVNGINRTTHTIKRVMELTGRHYGCLSSDRFGTFYFWSETVPGNAFTLDRNCNLVKGLFTTDMWQVCQPRVSPDGTKVARHDHDYEWLGGNKRGYISEKPLPGEDKFKKRYFFPKNEDMPFRGWMDAPFWSPDGKYLAFVYKPDVELLKKAGFNAEKGYSVIAICRTTGGPMVWLAPGGAYLFPSWGPVPQDKNAIRR
jgi:hypothetical protein